MGPRAGPGLHAHAPPPHVAPSAHPWFQLLPAQKLQLGAATSSCAPSSAAGRLLQSSEQSKEAATPLSVWPSHSLSQGQGGWRQLRWRCHSSLTVFSPSSHPSSTFLSHLGRGPHRNLVPRGDCPLASLAMPLGAGSLATATLLECCQVKCPRATVCIARSAIKRSP